MGLATDITNNVTGGLQELGQKFLFWITKLSTFISAQGVSQIVDVFEGDSTKFMDWIKSIEKYILLAGGDDDQTKRLTKLVGEWLEIIFKGTWLSILTVCGKDLKSENNIRFS